ncbi:MAG: aldo/keto reductase [Oscillospiraceae bacterium]|nr:aldo/keto reductase [Oscillospiraceae bacterium]
MFKSLNDTYKISNGVEIPCVGLGTWQSKDDVARIAVLSALSFGYRLIDTAAAYGNERGVGQGIKDSGLKREEIFVTSKLRNADHGYRSTMEAFELTMSKLGLDYLDLYLIHWPNPVQYRTTWKKAMQETWRAFEDLYEAGKIRAIGVSNFMPHHIDALMETARIKPMVNQLKLCPGITQPEIVDYCRANDIVVEAYSPFGTGTIFRSAVMQEMAARYGKTVGQLCLRWCLQMGFVSLPKSANPMRIKENTDIFDFVLEQADMDIISALEGSCGEAPDPDNILF